MPKVICFGDYDDESASPQVVLSRSNNDGLTKFDKIYHSYVKPLPSGRWYLSSQDWLNERSAQNRL